MLKKIPAHQKCHPKLLLICKAFRYGAGCTGRVGWRAPTASRHFQVHQAHQDKTPNGRHSKQKIAQFSHHRRKRWCDQLLQRQQSSNSGGRCQEYCRYAMRLRLPAGLQTWRPRDTLRKYGRTLPGKPRLPPPNQAGTLMAGRAHAQGREPQVAYLDRPLFYFHGRQPGVHGVHGRPQVFETLRVLFESLRVQVESKNYPSVTGGKKKLAHQACLGADGPAVDHAKTSGAIGHQLLLPCAGTGQSCW